MCPELCFVACFRPDEYVTNTYGPRWDVFSLGMVVLALLLGRTGEEHPGTPLDLDREEVRQDGELHDFISKALQR
jgi:hypothetical protein